MSEEIYDYLIVGAGPAGLQLAYYFEKSGRNYVVLERASAPGSFFEKFPRHRTLLSVNKVHTGFSDPEINLRWDWNSLLSEDDDPGPMFRDYSRRFFPNADDFCAYLRDYAQRHALRIRHDTAVEEITRIDGVFVLKTRCEQTYRARRLIIAAGRPAPFVPDIPGLKPQMHYASVDLTPEKYENKKVLIVGKGNSAFETADSLTEWASLIHLSSPDSLRFAWSTHYVGDLRAFNNNLLDTYQLKLQNAVLDADIESITPDGDGYSVRFLYAHANGEAETLQYDEIIACTGFSWEDSVFGDGVRPARTACNRFPMMTSDWASPTVPDMYFAGTLMHMRDYRRGQSSFIHGFRYNVRTLFHLLGSRYHGLPYPFHTDSTDAETLTKRILDRVNRSSGLWQQFGVLADFIEVRDGRSRHYEELPLEFAEEQWGAEREHYYAITLEYGPDQGTDPFASSRVARDDVDNADQSHFLHPVIRRYAHGVLVSEHHIIEDLVAQWTEDVHRVPLLNYLTSSLEESSKPLRRTGT